MRSQFFALISGFFLLCMYFIPVFSQNFVFGLKETWPLFPQVNDPQAVAMGRTEILSSSGSNAIFANPGLIAFYNHPSLNVSGRFFSGSISNDYHQNSDIQYKFNFKLPQFSFIYPITHIINKEQPAQIQWVIGAGLNTLYDNGYKGVLSIKNTEVDTITGGIKTTSNSMDEEIKSGLKFNTLTIGGGAKIQDKYYIGVALNQSMLSGGTVVDNNNSFNSVEIKNSYGDIIYSHTDSSITEIESEYDNVSGTFLTLGGMAQITPKWRLGVMFRTGMTVKMKIKEKEKNSSNEPNRRKLKYNIPSYWGVSAMFTPNNKIAVVGEYQTRPWSSVEINDSDSQLDNGNVLRLGGEYKMEKVTLRAGFFRESLPLPSEYNDETPVFMVGFSGGIEISPSSNWVFQGSVERGSWTIEINGQGDEHQETWLRAIVGISYYFD